MNLTVVGRSPWFGALRASLARALRRKGHFVVEREGVPSRPEGEILFVIGAHDHGPVPRDVEPTTVALKTEQDGSPIQSPVGFYDAYDRVFDIFPHRTDDAFPAWMEWDPVEPDWNADRPGELLYYGTRTERRSDILKSIDRETPVHEPAGFLAGEQKRIALSSFKATLVLHAWDGPSYEPFRLVEAASCGSLIIAEPGASYPWLQGDDFVVASSQCMAAAAKSALASWENALPARKRAWEKAKQLSADNAASFFLERMKEWVAVG